VTSDLTLGSNPEPPPSYELRARELQSVERVEDAPQSILEAFRP
jgi:hypothetical protein